MEIEYRPLVIEETSKACQLMNAAYARQKDPVYFEWMYFDCPLPSMLYGAFYKNTVIGIAGLLQRTFTNGAAVGVIMDVLVDEKFRGQGIFSTLISKLQQQFQLDLYCSFTNYYGMSAFTKGLKWENICKIDSLVYDFSSENQNTSQPKKTFTFQNADEFNITSKYLNWRFNKSPLYDYSVHKNPSGVVVTKIFTDPLTSASFGDIVYLKPTNNTIADTTSLLFVALEYFKQQKIHKLTTWALPQTLLYKTCTSMHWKSMQQERYLCVNIVNQNYNALIDPTAWNIFQADSEVF